MKVRVLIADDEPVARAGLRGMLALFEWVTVVGAVADGEAALHAVETLRPDVLLLDIEMPGLRGPDVLERIAFQPYVIFTTAHSEHAVTAFELGAVDYLVKPFAAPRLAAAMERVRAAIGEPAPTPALQRLAGVLGGGPISRLFVRAGRAIVPVDLNDVLWLASEGDYVAAHLEQVRHLLHVALHRLEQRLDPDVFLRIHRRYIVNLRRVSAFRRLSGARMVAEMTNGAVLPVSRARARDLRASGL